MTALRIKDGSVAALFILTGFLMGCAIHEIADVPTRQELATIERSRMFPNDFDSVWAAAVKTLSLSGYAVQNQDKGSGTISTDYFVTTEAMAMFTTGNRHKVNILIERKSPSATQVTITPAFQIRLTGKGQWEPTSRNRGQMNIETRTLDAIQTNLQVR